MKQEPLEIQVIVRSLVNSLGPGLVGEMCGMPGAAPVKRWQVRPPDVSEEEKLRIGYEVFQMIRKVEGAEIAMSWMIGMNPLLDNHSACRTKDGTPVTEIGLGYGREVIAAARAYLQDPMLT